MADLRAVLSAAAAKEFSGKVYRIVPNRYSGNIASMRGSLLHGARYNIRSYFGALYTSFSVDTARQEVARYFTRPPLGGFAVATIELRLSRVLDLRSPSLLRKMKLNQANLTGPAYLLTQEIGLRAWESGVQALIAPSAARPVESNLVVFLDNQLPKWRVKLMAVNTLEG